MSPYYILVYQNTDKNYNVRILTKKEISDILTQDKIIEYHLEDMIENIKQRPIKDLDPLTVLHVCAPIIHRDSESYRIHVCTFPGKSIEEILENQVEIIYQSFIKTIQQFSNLHDEPLTIQ